MTRIEKGCLVVVWEVADGYVGGARPHETSIPLEELDGLEGAELEDVIDEYVTWDFRETVCASYDMEEALALIEGLPK